MQGWILMIHDSYTEYAAGYGQLVDVFSDIESVCRGIADDHWLCSKIVDVHYDNDGEKALLTADSGKLFGAYLCKMPMRDDVPTKERVG